jgi:hypothetical protein
MIFSLRILLMDSAGGYAHFKDKKYITAAIIQLAVFAGNRRS